LVLFALSSNRPPFVVLGKEFYYDPEKLRQWLAAGGTRPTSREAS
jgi:hypothetical protein